MLLRQRSARRASWDGLCSSPNKKPDRMANTTVGLLSAWGLIADGQLQGHPPAPDSTCDGEGRSESGARSPVAAASLFR